MSTVKYQPAGSKDRESVVEQRSDRLIDRQFVSICGSQTVNVSGLVNGTIVEFLVDTGATVSLLPASFADKRKGGGLRFCVDYRKLNAAAVKDSYPLPRIDEALDKLSGSCYFSTLDLTSRYWQVEVNPSDRSKTAFVT